MRVGAEVESVCRKCGTVWHVVIALAEGRIANVECGDCGARHRYRSATTTTKKSATRSARAPSRKSRRASAALVEADLSRPRRPFRPSDTYEVGDRITHPSFGEGVVQLVRGPTKIEVLFGVGAKTLVHGRRSAG
jgi:hypothetical protein